MNVSFSRSPVAVPSPISGLRVFLSGPVSGLPYEEAVRGFGEAAARCRAAGATVAFSPVEELPEDASYAASMLVCLSALTALSMAGIEPYEHVVADVGALVSLPGWEASRGARMEREVAVICGIPAYDLDEVAPALPVGE